MKPLAVDFSWWCGEHFSSLPAPIASSARVEFPRSMQIFGQAWLRDVINPEGVYGGLEGSNATMMKWR